MYIDFKIGRTPRPIGVPAKGVYVDIDWMYGDADGDITRTIGPFDDTEARERRLLLEFLNILEGMLDLYPDGKGGWDGYENVPGYETWFGPDAPPAPGMDPADAAVRKRIAALTEYVPDGSGCIAEMTGFDVYWMDGSTPDRYDVGLVESGET